MINKNRKQRWWLVAVVLLLLGVAAPLWQGLDGNQWDAGLVSGMLEVPPQMAAKRGCNAVTFLDCTKSRKRHVEE
ncbi:MAG: hypothetical protein R6X15_07015 [Pseudomonadota bacterium]